MDSVTPVFSVKTLMKADTKDFVEEKEMTYIIKVVGKLLHMIRWSRS